MTAETRLEYCVIMTTTDNIEEAQAIAEILVAKKLAACVQRIPISSHYMWQEEIHSDAEFLLLIKTRSELFLQVQESIQDLHNYNIPEIIQVPIEQGAPSYLAWIEKNTGPINLEDMDESDQDIR